MLQPDVCFDSAKDLVLGNDTTSPLLPEEEPQISFDEIASPQLFDFCDPELLAVEAASCSNGSIDQHSFPGDLNFCTQPPVNEVAPTTNSLSLMCDIQNDLDDDISASINFSPCPQVTSSYFTNTNPALDFSQIQVTDNPCGTVILDDPVVPPQLPLPSVFEDDCLSSLHSFLPAPLSMVDGPVIFGGSNLLLPSEMQTLENDFIGGDSSSLFCPDSLQPPLNSNQIQALCGEGPGQWMRPGGTNENNLSTDISALEEPNYKAGKLSVEQRKQKIHRYMKKRNERNFSKKIKYACRKTLADSRPRVRGRFAKNDEHVGHKNHRANYGHREEEEEEEDDDDDDVHVKDEEDILDSDIFSHISGMNSFKFNNPIQSWI